MTLGKVRLVASLLFALFCAGQTHAEDANLLTGMQFYEACRDNTTEGLHILCEFYV